MRRREFLVRLPAVGASVAVARPQSEAIEIVVPPDGGTPRNSGRIERRGPAEFHVLASVEEGHSPLTHAVSRVDLIVRNAGPEKEVLFHFDLSGEGSRSNFDRSPFGGMPLRDFVYVQAPGQSWRRVDGRTDGWVATVGFPAPTGETRIGLSPWYTYADYLSFVGALPAHPHLQKSLLGKSDGGREHWELTITDPSTPPGEKRRVFWHAREHAYETFSSFAMEGLLEFLLSPAAAEYRRRFAFTIHPMTNVDGVANGYEYRTGYDYPEPRGTATGRLTFDAMDRLRPDLIVSWHNWIAPRNIQVVFYTDGEQGRASRRAWDLFTEIFPSPRAVGHRWEHETDPLANNWFGRKLSESNVHQYAMKRYGSRVWGWEMPWWGRDEGDPARHARRAGSEFARAWLETLPQLDAGPRPVQDRATVDIPCREAYEFELRGRSHVDNPYRDATLVGEFVSPSGKKISLEGFHCGDDLWRLRFVPEEEGEYRYLLRGEGVSLFAQGRLLAKAPRERGFIRVHPDNPYAFAYADRTPFFPMGDTCYGLHDDTPITPALRSQYLDVRRQQRFNFVRMSVGHSAKRAAAEPATFWAWGGTPEHPDLDRLNPRFFDSLALVLREMQTRGMNAELILLNFYRPPFTNPNQWTPTRERLWLRYVVARFASFSNIFMWTLANEYETHPDGKYRLNVADDVSWAKATARLVHELDPYRHPVTVHPVISSSARGVSTRDPFDPPWRIGGFFGAGDEIDVLSQQTSAVYRSDWDDVRKSWGGDAAGVENSLAADRVYHKPVMNTENGYEFLPGYPSAGIDRDVYTPDKVRRTSWRIVCAGGYFSAGFVSTIGHSDARKSWNHYPFLVTDAGAASQLAALYDFFTALPYWRMSPGPQYVQGQAQCLALAGEVYVVYLPHGGAITLALEPAEREFQSRWFDPRHGRFQASTAPVRAPQKFQAPDKEDWVLLVERIPG